MLGTTELVALATAVVVLVTAVMAWRTSRGVRQVHILVNSRMSDMETRVRQLTAALESSDTDVPPAPERGDEV